MHYVSSYSRSPLRSLFSLTLYLWRVAQSVFNISILHSTILFIHSPARKWYLCFGMSRYARIRISAIGSVVVDVYSSFVGVCSKYAVAWSPWVENGSKQCNSFFSYRKWMLRICVGFNSRRIYLMALQRKVVVYLSGLYVCKMDTILFEYWLMASNSYWRGPRTEMNVSMDINLELNAISRIGSHLPGCRCAALVCVPRKQIFSLIPPNQTFFLRSFHLIITFILHWIFWIVGSTGLIQFISY